MITKYLNPKRLFVAIVVALLPLAGCASSQDTASKETASKDAARDERVALLLADIDEAVDLSDEQSERIGKILAAAEPDQSVQGPPRGPRTGGAVPPTGGVNPRNGGGDPRAEMEARQAETDKKIEATLTETQIENYRKWRAAQPQRQPGPPPRGQ